MSKFFGFIIFFFYTLNSGKGKRSGCDKNDSSKRGNPRWKVTSKISSSFLDKNENDIKVPRRATKLPKFIFRAVLAGPSLVSNPVCPTCLAPLHPPLLPCTKYVCCSWFWCRIYTINFSVICRCFFVFVVGDVDEDGRFLTLTFSKQMVIQSFCFSK